MIDRINEHLDKFLLIYSDCMVVDGIKNAIIYDLTKREVYKIPRSYSNLTRSFKNRTLGQLKSESTAEEWENISSFIQYLFDHKLATFTAQISAFPEMDLAWNTPNEIVSAIIDFSHEKSTYDLKKVFDELNSLSCKHIEIRTFSAFNPEFLTNIIKWSKPYYFSSIELICQYDTAFNETDVKQIIHDNHLINKLTLTNAPIDHILHIDRNHISIGHITQTKQEINSNSHCGTIGPNNMFSPGITQFTESHHFNSCLNKKIAIDFDGEIKNCPSMNHSYGKIQSKTLTSVLKSTNIRDLWKISKNEITTCQTCELRYMCTDCRAYIQDPEDVYSKPLKCGYDPTTGKWSDWVVSDFAKKGIKHYQLLVS